MPQRRHRWPWWARRELIVPYLATVTVLAAGIIGMGYVLMGQVVAWRMGSLSLHR